MDLNLSGESWQVLIAFGVYIAGSVALGVAAHTYLKRGSFMEGYFLGHRGLGAWFLALTVAATAISGGTFMGFPSLVYSHGWVVALWICSYMVVPLTTMVLMGKRLNQAARVSGAVTVPDVFRDRFNSPGLGVLSSVLILLFVTFNLVAQFKGGALLMKEAMRLPPAPASLDPMQITEGADRQLLLPFTLTNGRVDIRKVPIPGEKAVFLRQRTEVDEARREVRLFFDLGDAQEPTAKVVRFPPQQVSFFWLKDPVDLGYLIGLLIFALTVVAYTTFGGFWAVTLTDLLAGLVMLGGIVILLVLALNAVPIIDGRVGLEAATESLRRQTPPDGQQGDLVFGPGPHLFLPLGLAFSFFLQWSMIGAGQPSAMVRLMSFKDSPSLRRALLLVCGYYFVIYVSLVLIFVCARAIFPTQYLREGGTEGVPDSITPALIRHLSPHPILTGFLLAAPYAAIISTVAAFLLMISSSLVRDLYQRTFRPNAAPKTLRRASYAITALVGVVVMIGAINPPGFLQYIIVFTTSGQGAAFLFPMALALYWRRSTRQGVIAGILGGGLAVLGLYVLGWLDSQVESAFLDSTLGWLSGWGEKKLDPFAPLYVFGLDPLVWGLALSLLLTVLVSFWSRPDLERVSRYFPSPVELGRKG